MRRLSKVEYEDNYLRATVTQQIIDQLNQSPLSPAMIIEYPNIPRLNKVSKDLEKEKRFQLCQGPIRIHYYLKNEIICPIKGKFKWDYWCKKKK
ncbi:hypothetical protein CDAR_590071 [Caerostris darwini]|uniref:Uncharacterized protein n=1 Tax=Caerostris darwini TaxID=1538125 RepID=A0AAV4NNE5_9ARAC|nr:hypothetical protein CDAR_590071 [Caerostris darwini]